MRDQYRRAIIGSVEYLQKSKYEVELVSQTLEDNDLCTDLAWELHVKYQTFDTNIALFKDIYRRCSFIIASRMHSIILASEFNAPFIALPYEPKFTGLATQLGYPENLSVPEGEVTSTSLITTIKIMESAHNQLEHMLAPKFQALRIKAEENLDWLENVIKLPSSGPT